MEHRSGPKKEFYVGDPGCTLDDLVMRPEDYRSLGIETPEHRERRLKVGDKLSVLRKDRNNVVELARVRERRMVIGSSGLAAEKGD